MPSAPFAIIPINRAANIATGCTPSDEETILGSTIWRVILASKYKAIIAIAET